jgi:hypothetical protein
MQLVAKLPVDVIRLRSPPLQLRRKEIAPFSQKDDRIRHTERASNVGWSRVCDRIAIVTNTRPQNPYFKCSGWATGIRIPADKEILYFPQMSGLYHHSSTCIPGMVILLSLNDSVQQNSSWDIQISSASQEIPRILWTLTVSAPCSQQSATFPPSESD